MSTEPGAGAGPAAPARVPGHARDGRAARYEALVEAGFDVALVVTRPDKRRGRGSETTPSPVKAAALALGLPVTHRVDDVLGVGADLGVVVAYGALIKPPVLAELPMVNLHFSLLPRWRGAAPVERALLAGDTETGVCVMQLEEGLDTGPVFARESVPIGADETAAELRADPGRGRHAVCWSPRCRAASHDPEPQVGEPTYAAKLDPGDLSLDWDASCGRAGPRRAGRWSVDDVPGSPAEGARRKARTW